MAGDRMTAQIGSRDDSFRLFDTEQANFGRYGYHINCWKDAYGVSVLQPLSSVRYSDISVLADGDGVVHLYAEWEKDWYDLSAVKIPRECVSVLRGFDSRYEYEAFAEVSAGNEDENYIFTAWSFPDGSTSADNPMVFQVLSAVELSANFKDLRTLLMWTKSGRIVMLRYSDISGDLDDGRKNVLRYRARGGEGVIYPFKLDQDLSAVSSLTILSVAEENINAVDQSAFIECENLWTVGCQFISSVETSAFANCGTLEHLYVPDLVSAGNCAFAGCSSLDSVSLPKVLSICENAFAGCQLIASAYAPIATDILSGAFLGCTGLTSVYFPRLSSIGNMAFDCGLSGSRLVDMVCPGLKYAAPSAFYGCGSLTSIDGVSGICRAEDGVFAGCGKLKTLTLLSADMICDGALSGCESLVSLHIPNVSAFGSSVFVGCGSLKRIDFGYTLSVVPSLKDDTFSGLSDVACYIPRNDDLYDKWISDGDWHNVMRNNNILIFEHTLAEAAARQAESQHE